MASARATLALEVDAVVVSLQSTRQPPSKNIRACMTVNWMMFVVFVFGLPFWSTLFNDTLGYGALLCTANGMQTQCGNIDYYAVWAKDHGRVRADGSLWACSCEEGVFSDSACMPTSIQYWSISHYISTAPGTGALVAVTAFPILFVWMYGGNNPLLMECVMHTSYTPQERIDNSKLLTLSQAFFQVFYGLFLFFSLCVFADYHGIVVIVFIMAEVAHMVLLAKQVGTHTKAGTLILWVTATGIAFMVMFCLMAIVATAFGSKATFFLYCFWLGECIGFSAILSIPCILVWVVDVPYESARDVAQPLTTEEADGDGK